jgi:hypothetical protein
LKQVLTPLSWKAGATNISGTFYLTVPRLLVKYLQKQGISLRETTIQSAIMEEDGRLGIYYHIQEPKE